MTEINPNEPIVVTVTERPNTVTVLHRGVTHRARWRDGESLLKIEGDIDLLRAALVGWAGESVLETTWNELAKHSGLSLPEGGYDESGEPLG